MFNMRLLFLLLFLSFNGYTQQFPDFKLVSLNGDTLTKADLLGKNVYINVFESWCPSCVLDVPLLNNTPNQLEDVIVIAITPAKTSKALKFKEKHNFTLPIYPNAEFLCREIGASQFPSHFFINDKGDFKRLRIPLGITIKNTTSGKKPKMAKAEWNRLFYEQNQFAISDAVKKEITESK